MDAVTSDSELLSAYAKSSDKSAIDGLIRQHIDLVYSTARRQVRDSHLAEDVTQAVFIILAQKAHRIKSNRLVSWLFQTTRYCAANAIKTRNRRAYHERHAARPEVQAMNLPSGLEEEGVSA